MLAEANFNPLHPKASSSLKRLRRFHEVVSEHSHRHFPTLVMNDGAAAYRDLSLRNRSVTHDFLARAWLLYKAIHQAEKSSGSPGARLVLATGFRMRGRRRGIDVTAGHFTSIMRRYSDGKLSAEQAISEAASIRQSFDIVPHLQANFAFTKAYVAESSGSRGGLAGPQFFVDLSIFSTPPPDWLVLGDTVHWS